MKKKYFSANWLEKNLNIINNMIKKLDEYLFFNNYIFQFGFINKD